MKHKFIKSLRSQYAEASCSCGWSYFYNQPRSSKVNRGNSLKQKHNQHIRISLAKGE
jgi:predicted nucleic-acid-binding Zn-ribbon protein